MDEWQNAPFKQTPDAHLVKDHILAQEDVIIRAGTEFDYSGRLGVGRVLEGLSQARELFDELTDTYDIEHAGFMPVVGALDTGSAGEYVVSRRINGEPCIDPIDDQVPDVQHAAARKLLEKLTLYAITKQEAQEPMLTDIFNLRQYRYIPETDTMVLIDTDPYFENELHCSLAHIDLHPLALQVLTLEEFQSWDSDMTKLSRQSETLIFDPSF